MRIKTLPAFTDAEFDLARELLAVRVASMLGRKMEEGDWDFVYSNAKRIPPSGWSNLKIDINHNGLGVEHKMMRVGGAKSILNECGTTKMHPAGTRSIRVEPHGNPDEVMKDVLNQYCKLIEARAKNVRQASSCIKADMRIGWLLWKESLSEFLYFEEEMIKPIPEEYYAHWNETPARGSRKASRSLWIYERATGEKKYSVTTTAGAKIQPYFRVPSPSDENLYHFKVQGVEVEGGLVQVWLTNSTAKYLERILGGLEEERITRAILNLRISESKSTSNVSLVTPSEFGRPVFLSSQAYEKLKRRFDSESDEYLFQQLTMQLDQLL